jgi:hypothetical protein
MTGYQYGELFRTWFEVFFCGGEFAEDERGAFAQFTLKIYQATL